MSWSIFDVGGIAQVNQSLESHSRIKVTVFDVSDGNGERCENLFKILNEEFSSTTIKHLLNPRRDLTSFPRMSEDANIEFNFVRLHDLDCSVEVWRDFQVHERVIAAIGVCYAETYETTSDLEGAVARFKLKTTRFPFLDTTKLFIMEPSEKFMSNVSSTHDFGDFVTFFPADRKLTDGVTSSVRFHLKVVMGNISAEILKSFDKYMRGEKKSSGRRSPTKTVNIPRTMIDGRRRVKEKQLNRMRRGRELKLKADICLLASSPGDAESYYCEAQTYCRKFEDWVWYAGSLEGRAAVLASLHKRNDIVENKKKIKNGKAENDKMKKKKKKVFYTNNVPVTVGDALAKPKPASIESLVKSAMEGFNKSEAYALWVASSLKLARYLAKLSRRRGVLECSSLLTSMWSRIRSELRNVFEIKDMVRIALSAASVSRQIGYERKCAFFLHEAANVLRANVIESSNSSRNISILRSSYNLEALAAKHYVFSISKSYSIKFVPFQVAILMQMLQMTRRIVDLDSDGGNLQDHEEIVRVAGMLLRNGHNEMSQEQQQYSLDSAIQSLSWCTRYMNGIPELIDFKPLELSEGRKPYDLTASSPSKSFVFNYAPESIVRSGGSADVAKKHDAIWVGGEVSTVRITLRNPLCVMLKFSSLSLDLDDDDDDEFWVDTLPCNLSRGLKPGETRTIDLNVRIITSSSSSSSSMLTLSGVRVYWNGRDGVPSVHTLRTPLHVRILKPLPLLVMSSRDHFWHEHVREQNIPIFHRNLDMKENEEKEFKIELQNVGFESLEHVVNVHADVYTAESSFETKQSLDLLVKKQNEAVLMTRFSLLEDQKLLRKNDVATLEIKLCGKSRCKRVDLHITYAHQSTSKCTRRITLRCEMTTTSSSSSSSRPVTVLQDVKVLSLPPSRCVPHIAWSTDRFETDSNSCAVLLDVAANDDGESVDVVLNDNDVVTVEPNRVESLFAIIPRCDLTQELKTFIQAHVRVQFDDSKEVQQLDSSLLSELSLRHLYRSPVRIFMNISGDSDDDFRIGDTIKLVSNIKILDSYMTLRSSEIFLWRPSSSSMSLEEMIDVGDIVVSGNTKRTCFGSESLSSSKHDSSEASRVEEKHTLTFVPLVSGQYYASTRVSLICTEKGGYGEDRTIWWNGVVEVEVEV
jgi:hypothetical protein